MNLRKETAEKAGVQSAEAAEKDGLSRDMSFDASAEVQRKKMIDDLCARIVASGYAVKEKQLGRLLLVQVGGLPDTGDEVVFKTGT